MIVKCPFCKKEESLFKIFILPAYAIYSCRTCRVRVAYPFVSNKQVYKSDFITAKLRYLDNMVMNSASRNTLSPYIDITEKRILDIGCGTGSFLNTLKEHNEVLGIDISEGYRPYLEKKNISHIIGGLSDSLSGLPDNYFDLITMWDVFEHLEDPRKTLSIIKNKLSSSGIIIIWTNNYDDCISFFAEMVYRISLGALSGLIKTSFNRSGGHNYNFTAKSLEGLYRNNGLKVIKSVITDTPGKKLTKNILFRIILELFYLANKLLGKGKIICHVLKKWED